MATACLRIKFTPLLEEIGNDDSKYNLEIVPEISCIQNVNNVQWNRQKDIFEYTIPMMYKICLSRRERNKCFLEYNDEQSCQIKKMYYSCVDLLYSSSTTSLSGDVTRIRSDNCIFSKIANYIESGNILTPETFAKNIKSINDRNIQHEDPELHTITEDHFSQQTRLYSYVENAKNVALGLEHKNNEDNDTLDSTKVIFYTKDKDHKQQSLVKSTIDKITCGQYKNTQSVKTITKINEYHKQRLSFTPICSIDTKEDPFTVTTVCDSSFTPNPKVHRFVKTNNVIVRAEDVNTHINLLKENTILNEFNESLKSSAYTQSKRILPQIRIAHFVSYMKKEFFPLQIMFNEIIEKMVSVNLPTTDKVTQQTVIKKHQPMKNNYRSIVRERHGESNRVVYSIFFDG